MISNTLLHVLLRALTSSPGTLSRVGRHDVTVFNDHLFLRRLTGLSRIIQYGRLHPDGMVLEPMKMASGGELCVEVMDVFVRFTF